MLLKINIQEQPEQLIALTPGDREKENRFGNRNRMRRQLDTLKREIEAARERIPGLT